MPGQRSRNAGVPGSRRGSLPGDPDWGTLLWRPLRLVALVYLALLGTSGLTGAWVPAAAQDAVAPVASEVSSPAPEGRIPLPELPLDFSVVDTPSDDGSSLTLQWDPDQVMQALAVTPIAALTFTRRAAEETEFAQVGSARVRDGEFRDGGLESGVAYIYRIGLEGEDGLLLYTAGSAPFVPQPNFFRTHRTNALILVLLMFGLVVGFILAARKGIDLFIRRIAGLDAIAEAVGRATEMGRKILYIPGIISVNEPQTLASLGILGYVAKLTARYGTKLEVPNIDPLTMAAAREIVKQSYLEEGTPEAFNEDMIHYITQDQFAYAAAVNGIMVRDRPAAIFLLGWFAAESLLLSETGQSVGAIQIAGTAQVTQLPFFVAACDYTMLGEELFAASAYLSKDPLILGSIKGQDMVKAVILVAIVVGVIMVSVGVPGFADLFSAL